MCIQINKEVQFGVASKGWSLFIPYCGLTISLRRYMVNKQEEQVVSSNGICVLPNISIINRPTNDHDDMFAWV